MSAPIIVCIDDEPSLCRALRLLLARTGARVETFTHPEEALVFLRHNDVALVLCDYRLPSMHGLAVLARLEKPVPFVILSGDLDIEHHTASNPGVTAVLGKPFEASELLALVERILPPRADGDGDPSGTARGRR
ncbi:MAG: response regulator [Sandaracinus sp.]